MTTAWSHLPNAAQIDRILADFVAHTDKWSAAKASAKSDSDALQHAVAHAAAFSIRREHVWYAALDAAGKIIDHGARSAAISACYALITWDDCAYLLKCDPEHVKVLALLGSDAAIMLYPACIALQKEMEIA